MAVYGNRTTSADQKLAYPCYGLDETAALYDDLANHIYWRFGVSENSAEALAGDIYKFIEN